MHDPTVADLERRLAEAEAAVVHERHEKNWHRTTLAAEQARVAELTAALETAAKRCDEWARGTTCVDCQMRMESAARGIRAALAQQTEQAALEALIRRVVIESDDETGTAEQIADRMVARVLHRSGEASA